MIRRRPGLRVVRPKEKEPAGSIGFRPVLSVAVWGGGLFFAAAENQNTSSITRLGGFSTISG